MYVFLLERKMLNLAQKRMGYFLVKTKQVFLDPLFNPHQALESETSMENEAASYWAESKSA